MPQEQGLQAAPDEGRPLQYLFDQARPADQWTSHSFIDTLLPR